MYNDSCFIRLNPLTGRLGLVPRRTNLVSLTGGPACPPTPHRSRSSSNESCIPHGRPGLSADTTSVSFLVERILYPSWEARLVRRHHIGLVPRGTNLVSLTGGPACPPTPHRSRSSWNESCIPHGRPGLSVTTIDLH